jgi:hypothetical protein
MSKLLNDKDFFICTGGIMPTQMQTVQRVAKKKDGTLFLMKTDTATSSIVDFSCKKMMILMAIIAVVVCALVVSTGGMALIAAAAIGGAIGAVAGALICGQQGAAARMWIGPKSDLKILGTSTLTDSASMKCMLFQAEIRIAPHIKNWWQAAAVGLVNFTGEMFKCVMVGAAAAGVVVLATQGVGAFVANAGANYLMSWTTGWGLGLRGVMGVMDGVNQKYINGTSTEDAVVSGLGSAAFGMEKGTANSAYNVATGQGTFEDYTGLLGWGAPIARGNAEKGGMSSNADHMGSNPWEGKPQRGKTGYLESPRMSRAEMQAYKKTMAEQGIKVEVDKAGRLPEETRAGFDNETGTIYVRKGATKYEAFHEQQHAQQWKQMGKEAYQKQSRAQREQYVYDQIMKNKDQFSPAELDHATNYINRVRALEGLEPVSGKKTDFMDGDLFEDGAANGGRGNGISYEGFGGDIQLQTNKTTTVIGKFNDSVNGGGTSEILKMDEGTFTRGGENKGGINILDIPSAKYEQLLKDYGPDMGKQIFWDQYNQPFLENSFKNGDNVRLLSDPNVAENRTGFYERELREIEGYHNGNGEKVVGLAEKYGYEYNPINKTYVKIGK